MTEPTMEEYITITRINHESGHGRGRIELKVDSLNVPNVSHDRISVSIFPVSLTGAASDWFKDESIGSITKWVDLPDKFFRKFYPPSRVGRKVKTNEVNKMILWDAVDTKFENCGHSEWPTYNWRDEGYCNGGNFLGAFQVRNTLQYKDYEWYEVLEEIDPKDEALRNKAALEESINQKRNQNDDKDVQDEMELNKDDITT
ncbi:hypothetical protein Tco_0442816 [Tanacetum coccineum]